MTLRFSVKMVDGKLEFVDDHPVPQVEAHQESPRRFYVYAHTDPQGQVFYVGKGTGKRAWSKERHPLWARYVERHLAGRYDIRILADNLSEEEAEDVEARFMGEYDDLINWQNLARKLDYGNALRHHERQKANQVLIQEAKSMERNNPESAVELYLKVIENVKAYDDQYDATTLLGQLQEEEKTELGYCGKPEGLRALNRLTMCLMKLRRYCEASKKVEGYFAVYPRDNKLRMADHIRRRVEKALASDRPKSKL